MGLLFNYSGIQSQLSEITAAFSGVPGDIFNNAQFTFQNVTNYILDPNTGNYVPDGTTSEAITARLQRKRAPEEIKKPGIDFERLYFEGNLMSPKKRAVLQDNTPCSILLHGVWVDGVFEFVLTPRGAIDESIDMDTAVGQPIRGFWTRKK